MIKETIKRKIHFFMGRKACQNNCFLKILYVKNENVVDIGLSEYKQFHKSKSADSSKIKTDSEILDQKVEVITNVDFKPDKPHRSDFLIFFKPVLAFDMFEFLGC